MSEATPRVVPDGEPIRQLPGGLEIVRREKHDWKDGLDQLPPDRLAKFTGKVWGSKFYPGWSYPALVKWIEAVVTEAGWTLQPGDPVQGDWDLPNPVGIVSGRLTRRIRVVSDGRYVHAYPISE